MVFSSSSLFWGFCGGFCPLAALQYCRSPSCDAGGCGAVGGFSLQQDALRQSPGLHARVGQVWALLTQAQLQLFHMKINVPKIKGKRRRLEETQRGRRVIMVPASPCPAAEQQPRCSWGTAMWFDRDREEEGRGCVVGFRPCF